MTHPRPTCLNGTLGGGINGRGDTPTIDVQMLNCWMFGEPRWLSCQAACAQFNSLGGCNNRAHQVRGLRAGTWRGQELSRKRLRATLGARSDLYGLLQVEPTASASEIKSAYRRLARKYHPDVTSKAAASFQVCQDLLPARMQIAVVWRPNHTWVDWGSPQSGGGWHAGHCKRLRGAVRRHLAAAV